MKNKSLRETSPSRIYLGGSFVTLPGYTWVAVGDETILYELEIMPPGFSLPALPQPSVKPLWGPWLASWTEKWERGIEKEEDRFPLFRFTRLFPNPFWKGEEGSSLTTSGNPMTWAQRVYLKVLTIPRGKVLTYGEIARALERPKASRAVARALKMNPLPLLIPCHRVVGKDNIGGYSARGGIRTKILLLTHEGALPFPRLSPREP